MKRFGNVQSVEKKPRSIVHEYTLHMMIVQASSSDRHAVLQWYESNGW